MLSAALFETLRVKWQLQVTKGALLHDILLENGQVEGRADNDARLTL